MKDSRKKLGKKRKSVWKRQKRWAFTYQINDVLKKGNVKNTRNLRACLHRLINVDKAKEVC